MTNDGSLASNRQVAIKSLLTSISYERCGLIGSGGAGLRPLAAVGLLAAAGVFPQAERVRPQKGQLLSAPSGVPLEIGRCQARPGSATRSCTVRLAAPA
jgi:hypothetical protein